MKKLLTLSVLCLFLNSGFLHAGDHIDSDGNDIDIHWKAGVAKVNITPKQSMWLSGYGARNRPSEGTLHEIWAKALAFEDANGRQAVLVTSDLLGFPKNMSDPIRNRIEARFGLSKEQILLNSSHTHTGPSLPRTPPHREHVEEYGKMLEDQIVELVGEALQSLEPARIYAENGLARFAVNRRNNPEGRLHELSELAGPSDHSVPVLKVENSAGELIAVAFGYACHPTVLSFYKWSGDYPGFAQIELEKTYPGATALFFQGAGADQNPLPRRTVPLAEQYGKELTAAVKRVLSEEMRPLAASLSTAYTEVELHFANPPTEERLLEIAKGNSDYPEEEIRTAQSLLDDLEQGESLMTSYPYPLQVWLLGDQPIMSLGGELLVDYAIALKRIFGQHTFVLGYSNDYMGYIPSARVLEEGGYEAARSPGFATRWHPDIEITILRGMVRLAEEAGISAPW